MSNSNGDVDCLQQQPLSNKSVVDECSVMLPTSPPPPAAPAAPAVEVRWHQFLHACCILMLQGMVFLTVPNGLQLVNRAASPTQYFVSLSSHSICFCL
jgi:hypothetical protein